jgi:hypothetical protein
MGAPQSRGIPKCLGFVVDLGMETSRPVSCIRWQPQGQGSDVVTDDPPSKGHQLMTLGTVVKWLCVSCVLQRKQPAFLCQERPRKGLLRSESKWQGGRQAAELQAWPPTAQAADCPADGTAGWAFVSEEQMDKIMLQLPPKRWEQDCWPNKTPN